MPVDVFVSGEIDEFTRSAEACRATFHQMCNEFWLLWDLLRAIKTFPSLQKRRRFDPDGGGRRLYCCRVVIKGRFAAFEDAELIRSRFERGLSAHEAWRRLMFRRRAEAREPASRWETDEASPAVDGLDRRGAASVSRRIDPDRSGGS